MNRLFNLGTKGANPVRVALALAMTFAVVAALTLAPELALAQTPITLSSGKTVGAVAGNVGTSLTGVGTVITIVSYVCALFVGIGAIFKFKAHADQPDRTPLKTPIMLLFVSAMFAAIGEVLGTGIATLWGGGAQTVAP